MPPMPPPPPMAGMPPSFFGFSATIASVVISSPAIDDALGEHVDVLAVLGVEAVGILILFEDLADDDGPVLARIDRDLARRPAERLAHDLDAGLLVVVLHPQLLQHLGGAQQRHAAARQDAFLDRGAGGMHGIVHAVLALLDLDLGRAG